jgi:hypothetical protein
MTAREVVRIVAAMPTSDGAGVKLKRSIGSPVLEELDPFLLLDNIESDEAADYIAGFPEHPHRGFETVTYMLEGRMRHRDSTGAEGVLEPGGAQWMTAGRGVLHSEMPEQEDGRLHGFQLWVNLPAARKMIPARHQNITPEEIPEIDLDGKGKIRVVAGTVDTVSGPIGGIDTDPLFAEVSLVAGGDAELQVSQGHTAFVYVFAGDMGVEDTLVPTDNLAVLGDGDSVHLSAGENGARALLVAARPIGEPIARHGPFVMNTRDEIMQAFADLRSGNFLS